jgi:NAD(P)-dependent dehydrogenase (short-subunit alcohol dehydrogenase family)
MNATLARPHAGRVAVVTGVARRIGQAIAARMARAGAHLVLADADEAGLAAALARVKELGAQATSVAGDLSQESVATATIEAATKSFGQLDILVNNAGRADQPLLNHYLGV